MSDRPLTYAEVGATRDTELPKDYTYLHVRVPIGRHVVVHAGEMLLTWRMHEGAGVRVRRTANRIATGTEVTCRVGVGPVGFDAPCRVVWTIEEERRIGFAYGTLTGHPESGEESFVVEEDDDGGTWLVVTAFTRPAAWYTRLAGPIGGVMQRALVRRYGRALQQLCR